jgi:hypothetical protein
MHQPQKASTYSTPIQPDITQESKAHREKGREFFQQLQPTFAIDLPSTAIKLQFLDEKDPGKDTIVRKKAREWVNRNRSISSQSRQNQKKSKANVKAPDIEDEADDGMQLQRCKDSQRAVVLDPLQGVGKGNFDPFNLLPDIGRRYDHIIEYCEFTLYSVLF